MLKLGLRLIDTNTPKTGGPYGIVVISGKPVTIGNKYVVIGR